MTEDSSAARRGGYEVSSIQTEEPIPQVTMRLSGPAGDYTVVTEGFAPDEAVAFDIGPIIDFVIGKLIKSDGGGGGGKCKSVTVEDSDGSTTKITTCPKGTPQPS